MIWIRSSVYAATFLAWTIVCALVGLPALLTSSGAFFVIHIWARGIMILARWIADIRYEIQGLEHLPRGQCIVAFQHQSAFETFLLILLADRPTFVLKKEVGLIPFIGWYAARAGMIYVDRGAGASAMRKVIRGAKLALARNSQIMISPEGARTTPGTEKKYLPGIAALYAHCDAPVIPMALNSGYYWGKTRLLKIPGKIVFRFLPAIPDNLDKKTFLMTLKQNIEAAASNLPKPSLL